MRKLPGRPKKKKIKSNERGARQAEVLPMQGSWLQQENFRSALLVRAYCLNLEILQAEEELGEHKNIICVQ